MKKYESYTVEDFIQDDDFRDWVQGHSQRASFWDSFLQRYPATHEAFRQAEQFIRATDVAAEPIAEGEIRREVEQFIERAGAYNPTDQPVRRKPGLRVVIGRFHPSVRWGMAVAAVLVVIVGAGWYRFANRQSPGPSITRRPDAPVNQLVETINHTHQLLRVVLHDSSEVLLSPQSRLRYPAQFGGNARIVYLKGQGMFSVKRQNRPFMVYTGETITKVLGTRFVVRAFDVDRKITVQVLSGKVQVYKAKADRLPANKEVNGLILYANQAAIFEKAYGNLTKTLVTNPSVVVKSAPTTNQFVYDEVPLPIILRELEKSYGIPIQFDEQSFGESKITAVLTHESLYEKLDLLCKAASATYEITDGQIVISRKGYR